MQCPKCQHENLEIALFYVQCGEKLGKKCPQCGFDNDPAFKFCAKCRQNLSKSAQSIPQELSFDEKLQKIQKHLPGGLTEKILAQRGKIESERKQVTVMFADMEGFTID